MMKQLMENWRRFIEEEPPLPGVEEGAFKNLALGAAVAGQLATATPAYADDTPQEPPAVTQQVKQPSLNLKGTAFEKVFNALKSGSMEARKEFSSKGRYGFLGGQLDVYAKTPEASLKKLDLNAIKDMAEKHYNTVPGQYAQSLLNDLGVEYEAPSKSSFNPMRELKQNTRDCQIK